MGGNPPLYTELTFDTGPIAALSQDFRNLAATLSGQTALMGGAVARLAWSVASFEVARRVWLAVETYMVLPSITACDSIADVLDKYVQAVQAFQKKLDKELTDEVIASVV